MFHDDWGLPIVSHRGRDLVEWPRIALGRKVSVRIVVDKGQNMHTIGIFEIEIHGFTGNVSDVFGDVTFDRLARGI